MLLKSFEVKQEWVDYNSHMNMAYYVLVFDQALEAVSYTHLTLPTKA